MLSRLTTEQQAAELRSGPAWIRSWTGQREVSFCYPWGGPETYTSQTVQLLADLGYSLAFNTVRRPVSAADGRFELPRVDTRDLPPHAASHVAMATSGAEGD
jgi:peptidoglycan/xylan/chitin deacetylase (PgdA/CDA1 family)